MSLCLWRSSQSVGLLGLHARGSIFKLYELSISIVLQMAILATILIYPLASY